MAASSRGVNAVRGLLQTSAASRLCRQCATTAPIFRAPALASKFRSYSAAAGTAAATTTTAAGTPVDVAIPADPAPGSARALYRIKAGIILTRAPLLTEETTPFEDAFYFYQKRLNERLCMPFVTKVYFKPDTPALMDWNMKVAERKGTVAKELGVYQGKASTSWQDELMVGDETSRHGHLYQSLLKDAVPRVSDDAEIIPKEDRAEVEVLPSRVTEADVKGDQTRLDRKLDRTLYMVVKNSKGQWLFPSQAVGTEKNLHETARDVMDRTAGINMNTWVVGRVPVAHHVRQPEYKEDGTVRRRGDKTFFIKGRIMAGQADLEGNPYGYTEFKWLTREELKEAFEPGYYHALRNMMAIR